MFWLEVTNGGGTIAVRNLELQDNRIDLRQGIVDIGRSMRDGDSAFIEFSDAMVSRHHCRLHVDDGEVELEDVGSTGGTIVNGERFWGKGRRRRLADGDVIELGARRIILHYDGAGSADPDDPTEVMTTQVDLGALLMVLGANLDPAQALDELSVLKEKEAGELDIRLLKTEILLRLGKPTNAAREFPPLDRHTSWSSTDWIEVLAQLVEAGVVAVDDERVERSSTIPPYLESVGALRPAALAWRAQSKLCELAGDHAGKTNAEARVRALSSQLLAALR